jgi:hypothetical protein
MDNVTKDLLTQIKFSSPRKVDINSQEFSIKSLYDLVEVRKKLFFEIKAYLKNNYGFLDYNEEQLDDLSRYIISNAAVSNWWWVLKSAGLYAISSTINDLYINQGKRALTYYKVWIDFKNPIGRLKDAKKILDYFDLALDFLNTQNISSILHGEGFKFLEGLKVFVENTLSGKPISIEMIKSYFKSTAILLKYFEANQQSSTSEFLSALLELYCDIYFIKTYYDAPFKLEKGEYITAKELRYIQKLVELKKIKLFTDALDVLAGIFSIKGDDSVADSIKAVKSTLEIIPFKLDIGFIYGLDNEIRNLNDNFKNDVDGFVARFKSVEISKIVEKAVEGKKLPLSYAVTLNKFIKGEETNENEIRNAIKSLKLDKTEISYLFLARNKSFEKQPVLKLWHPASCVVYDGEPYKDCVVSPYLHLKTYEDIIGEIPCDNAKGNYYITIWGRNGNLVSNEPLKIVGVRALDYCYLALEKNTIDKLKFSTKNAFKKTFKKNGLYYSLYFYKFFIQQKDPETGEKKNVYIYNEKGFITDESTEDFLQFEINGSWFGKEKLKWWIKNNYGYITFVVNNELLKWKNYLQLKTRYYDNIEKYYLLGKDLINASSFRILFDRVTNNDLYKLDRILKLDCVRTLHNPVCSQQFGGGFLLTLKAYYAAVRLKHPITDLQKLKQLEVRGLRRYELKHALYYHVRQLAQSYGIEFRPTEEQFCKLFSKKNPGKPCKSWFYESFILNRYHIIECPDLGKDLICRSDFKIARKINLIKYIGKIMDYHSKLKLKNSLKE